jgi:hypothetical protein
MADIEDRFLLGVGFKVGYYDGLKKGADGRRDIASAEVIEKAAWQHLREQGGRLSGIQHMDGTLGHAELVESYIYRGPDWLLKTVDGQEVVIEAGDWLLGYIVDEATWALAKAGKLNGLSAQGRVARRPITRSA